MTKDNISAYNKSLTPEERSERTRKAGIESGKARRENRKIRDRLLDKMTDDDWNEIIDGAIQRAKGDDKAFVILRDTLGQKPPNRTSFENEKTRFVVTRVHIDDGETTSPAGTILLKGDDQE